jgi:cytochrome c553
VRWIAAFLLSASGSLAGDGGSSPGKVDPRDEEFFESKIRPILVANCLECHGPEKHKGGLRLDGRMAMLKGGDAGAVIVPGKPDESTLVTAIRYDGELQMPPRAKLRDDEIAAVSSWVKRGAPWPVSAPRPVPPPNGSAANPPAAISPTASPASSIAGRSLWSLKPVRDVTPPAVKNERWVNSPIDRFILARMEQNGLAPAPPASKAVLIRRVTFDLIGLPPEPADVDAFLADHSAGAIVRVVDRLLASPHYGERWGRHWLDVARYGEDQAHSFQPRLYPAGYRYRDWLTRAFNTNMPYDRFILEQIAGDLLEEPGKLDRLPALGFFACGPVYYGDEKKFDQYADRVDTLTRGFLGLTVACARCHDHKYDPISTADYYALAGVFASTEYVETPAVPKEQVDGYNKGQSAIEAKETEINAFIKAENERLKKKPTKEALKETEKSLAGDARKKLTALKEELAHLKKNAPAKYPVIHALRDVEHPVDVPILIRGNVDTPGPKAPRRFLAVLGGEQAPFRSGSGRLELARAIASPDNPLTARVMINRIWQHHFGRGLVATASNLGSLGDEPTHPELLDWLSDRFVASGWSVKTIHREILLSSVYQQSSHAGVDTLRKDPGNLLLARMNRRRLEVEAWRDATLAVSGRLDQRLGGPSVSLEDASNVRRTAYAAISRHDLAWMLRLFDYPDPNITSGGRVETTVPLQELFVLNSEFLAKNARSVAERLLADQPAAPGDDSLVTRAYRLVFGREPSGRELAIGVEYIRALGSGESVGTRSERLSNYAHALLATNEFLFID